MSYRIAVDFSESTDSPRDLTTTMLNNWYDFGVRTVLVQYSAELPFYLSVLDADGRFDVVVYVYEYFPLSPWQQTPEARVANAIHMCQGHRVSAIYPDVEDPNDDLTPQGQRNIVASLKRCRTLIQAAGYLFGIYTGYYVWRDRTGDSQEFKDAPLWFADYLYDGLPTPGATPTYMPTKLPGGWTTVRYWQYQNTTFFGGRQVDMNIEQAQDVPAVVTQPTLEQALVALVRAGTIMAAGDQNLADLDTTSKNALRWIAEQVIH